MDEHITSTTPTTHNLNYTRSKPELYILIVWSTWSFLSALIGNAIILAGLHHKAFRIDKLSLLTIKNLTISDIYFNVIWVLPTVITLYSNNQWVLGPGICTVTTYLQYPPAIATIFFITLLSVNKWVRCQFPLKTLDITTKQTYKITVGVWGVSFLHPAAYFLSNLFKPDNPRTMELDLYKGSCDYHHGTDLARFWNGLDLACAVLCCLLPSMALLGSNAAILYIVRSKGRGSVKRSNLMMIISLTYLFFVSYTPYTIKYLMPFLSSNPHLLPNSFVVMTYFLLYVNSWANLFIYYLTNATFKKYVNCLLSRESYKSKLRGNCSTSVRVVEKSRLAHMGALRTAKLAKLEGLRKQARVTTPNTDKDLTIMTDKLEAQSIIIGEGMLSTDTGLHFDSSPQSTASDTSHDNQAD